jgi:putative ABC transport system permease protein
MLGSLDRLMNVDPGFSPDGVMTARFLPSDSRYRQAGFRRLVIDEILARVRALPGVESAGAIHFLPVVETGPSVRVVPDSSRPTDVYPAAYRVVTPGYFETMRIPLRRGRLIAATDDGAAAPAAVINERMAAVLWPGQEAVGQRLYRTNGASWEIVGVVGDVRQHALALPPSPELYLPMAQSEWANAMTIVARSRHDDPSLAGQIANAIHDVNPGLPVTRVASMMTLLGESVHEHRFYTLLFTVFGALAPGLGAVGVYGVSACLAERRRREIGIRLALGATRCQVVRREMWRSGVAVLAGLSCGALGAIAVVDALRGMLFNIAPAEPGVLLGAVTVLGGIAWLAMMLPIRMASRVDPLTVMRDS